MSEDYFSNVENFLNRYCYHCGADWSNWYDLTDSERDEILERNPDAEVGNLAEDCCPSCGCSFLDEDDSNEDY